MRAMLLVLATFASGVAYAAKPAPGAAPVCPPSGDLGFVCGLQDPEDIVSVPGTSFGVAVLAREPPNNVFGA